MLRVLCIVLIGEPDHLPLGHLFDLDHSEMLGSLLNSKTIADVATFVDRDFALGLVANNQKDVNIAHLGQLDGFAEDIASALALGIDQLLVTQQLALLFLASQKHFNSFCVNIINLIRNIL